MSIRKASKLIWLISAALCCVFVLAISTHLQSQIAAKDIPEYQTPEEPPKINNAMPDNIVYWQVAQLLPQDVIIRHEEKIIPLNERLEIKQTFIRPGGKSCKIFYAASGTMAESKNIENGLFRKGDTIPHIEAALLEIGPDSVDFKYKGSTVTVPVKKD